MTSNGKREKVTIGAYPAFNIKQARDRHEELRARVERGQSPAGTWMRLDPTVWPTMFRGATVTRLELEHLRGIENLVRLGRVKHIDTHRLQLERGERPARAETLYVDCTARTLDQAAQAAAAQSVLADGLGACT